MLLPVVEQYLPTTRRRSRATGGFTPTAGLPRPPLPVGWWCYGCKSLCLYILKIPVEEIAAPSGQEILVSFSAEPSKASPSLPFLFDHAHVNSTSTAIVTFTGALSLESSFFFPQKPNPLWWQSRLGWIPFLLIPKYTRLPRKDFANSNLEIY